jgi:hypothetical protein
VATAQPLLVMSPLIGLFDPTPTLHVPSATLLSVLTVAIAQPLLLALPLIGLFDPTPTLQVLLAIVDAAKLFPQVSLAVQEGRLPLYMPTSLLLTWRKPTPL